MAMSPLVRLPPRSFVPQRPYLPLGTLASALLYPRGDNCGVSTARLPAVLEEVGLGALAGAVHDGLLAGQAGCAQRIRVISQIQCLS